MATERYELDLDTAVLRADRLSDYEKKIAADIENRLREVEKLAPKKESREEFSPDHYAQADDRRQRVLLLDGGRGTGKTSFLVTLIDRWNRAACYQEREEWPSVPNPPNYVRVLRILDFDPVPASMPLLAAIVHSWRPLAQYYDSQLSNSHGRDDYDDRRQLMDDWNALFRVAAAGWSELPRAKGLLEEVLDREEQVRDWQYFREHWQWFVDRVVDVGRRIRSVDHLDRSPAFVVVIDDVDLQVARIRELLPALRLLAHDNVFFLVGADLVHLRAMLTLEFYGQQVQLASATSPDLVRAYDDRWAQELARASIEKVFPIRNRWRLEKLSLTELLRYPQPDPSSEPCSSTTIHGVLDRVTAEDNTRDYWGADRAGATTAGDAAQALADAAEAAALPLRVASYRSAQQLWQTVRDVFSNGDGTPSNSRRPAELLGKLVAPEDDLETVVRLEGDRFAIRVTTRGELSALYFEGPADTGGADDVVLSDRPDFLYLPDDDRPLSFMSKQPSQFNFSAGLLAKTLQELKFPVDATTLTWTTHLTMAWTRWRLRKRTGSFAWPWYTHPRPDELLQRTGRWGEYLRTIGKIAEQKKHS